MQNKALEEGKMKPCNLIKYCTYLDNKDCAKMQELEELVNLQATALNKACKRIRDYEIKAIYANHKKLKNYTV